MKTRMFMALFLAGLFIPGAAAAQDASYDRVQQLEARVRSLEEYIRKLPPVFDEFSEELLSATERQIRMSTSRTVRLNPVSKKVKRIDSNTGSFLVAVTKMEKIVGGYRLLLDVGNPNAAVFSDLKFVLRWGENYNPALPRPTYAQWREELNAARYSYQGDLESGKWTEVAVDLIPMDVDEKEYIECEIEAGTVKLLK